MSHVRVRLQWKGVRLEYHGTLTFFERVVEPLVAAAAAGHAIPTVAAGPSALALDGESVIAEGESGKESEEEEGAETPAEEGYRPDSADFGHFIRQLGPEAGEPDRQIVAFAFFLWNYDKKEEFGEDEVAGCFRSLGLPVPDDAEDLYRDLSERKRFLDPGATSDRWRLTQKGRNYVKTRLLGSARD